MRKRKVVVFKTDRLVHLKNKIWAHQTILTTQIITELTKLGEWTVMTKLGEWAVMTKLGEWAVMTKLGEWAVMTKLGEWAVMHLCFRDIDFASLYDFYI
jgi:hypothetical protein